MVPSLGIMIGMYIIVRYCEIASTCSIQVKVALAILILITISIMWSSFIVPQTGVPNG